MHFQYGIFIVLIFFYSHSRTSSPFGFSVILISLVFFFTRSRSIVLLLPPSVICCEFEHSFFFFSLGYFHAAQRNGDIIINMVLLVMRCDAIELAASVRLEFSNSNNIGCLQRLWIIFFYFAASFFLSLRLHCRLRHKIDKERFIFHRRSIEGEKSAFTLIRYFFFFDVVSIESYCKKFN